MARFFAFLDDNQRVRSTYTHPYLLPGTWIGQTPPPDCVEVDESRYDLLNREGGWSYVNGYWIAPPPTPPVVTQRELILLFTKAEYLDIKASRASDPDLDYAWDLVEADGEPVDLGSPQAGLLLQMLVSKNKLTQERAESVLAGESPPTPSPPV